ncbi:MAG: hypothetical protein CMH46_15035 [Muricauda sp.]|nr:MULTISPECIES: EF-hand domain-containing protein [unclassified Allomuricauda]MAU16841.1 hypothetical protein [Allomuricauda sp.]|tara:strand:+ start:96 stop:476 length:381 start_codon:yes stop_codon:yes gene_type:complete
MNTSVKTLFITSTLVLSVSCGSKNKQANNGDKSSTEPKVEEQQQKGPPQGRPPQEGGPNGGRQQGGPPSFSQLLSEMDINKDGQLEKDEIQGPLSDDFTKVDSNNDGFITEEEFKNAPRPERNTPR